MKEFYKILHENQKHYGMQYHLGLNEDVEPFDETLDCGGGIFFADKEQVLEYLTYDYGTKLAIIEIPENEKIVKVGNKFKTHRIVIKEIKNLWTEENYEWLLSYFGESILFQYVCESGSLLLIKKLINDYKIDIHIENEYAFRNICKNGYLKVAKWIYNLGDINIHALNDLAFRWSCANGHLEVAKWLHSLGGVNIHANTEYAFQSACANSHLEVAKWLHDLGGINIHADDNYVFEFSPEEIINWLNTL